MNKDLTGHQQQKLKAIRQNNAAVSMIKSCDEKFRMSVLKLTSALRFYRSCCRESSNVCTKDGSTSPPPPSSMSLDLPLEKDLLIDSSWSATGNGDDDDDDDTEEGKYNIFCAPHSIPTHLAYQPSREYYVYASCIIIFNLGLAYQLHASNETSEIKRKQNLKKAARLYELAYAMEKEFSLDCVSVRFLILTTLNNLAVARCNLNDHKTAKNYFAYISPIWMGFMMQGGDVPSHLNGFLRNIQKITTSPHKESCY